MKHQLSELEQLITLWREEHFKENNNLYSTENYRLAERKYVRYKIREYQNKKLWGD